MPVSADKLDDLHSAQTTCGASAVLRLMVDHPAQIAALTTYNGSGRRTQPWSVFCKVDGGGRRAGVPPESPQMRELVTACMESDAVEIYGFYSRASLVSA